MRRLATISLSRQRVVALRHRYCQEHKRGNGVRTLLCYRRKRCAYLVDFCQITYHLACLFARLLCRGNSYIVRLCACCRSLKTGENPAQSGMFFPGNRLSSPKSGNWAASTSASGNRSTSVPALLLNSLASRHPNFVENEKISHFPMHNKLESESRHCESCAVPEPSLRKALTGDRPR